MPLHRTLHQVRCYLPWFLLIHVPIRIILYSTCSSYMSAVTSWLWLSSVRSSHVQQTWIRERKYDSCMPSYNIRMPCVRPSHLSELFSCSFFFFKKKAPLFFGNMVARYAWVVNSPIKHYNVRLKTRLGTPAHKHNYVAKENVACLHR